MQHLKLTFEDIMQTKILFYDHHVEAACFNICSHLQIDNLPAIDGQHFYELTGKVFKKMKIREEHIISVSESLFSSRALEQFKANRHNVLFVFEEQLLRGVVHICDYNRDILLQFIHYDVLSLERKLRQLIVLNGYKNDNMLEFFNFKKEQTKGTDVCGYYKGRISNFIKKKDEINSLGPFQLIEFSDLMDFAGSEFSNEVHKIIEADTLRKLRNLAMHGKNPIEANQNVLKDENRETIIYSLASLDNLFNSLNILRNEYVHISLKIRRHPDYLKSIELENRSKLEIIHSHHPKALEYFLSFQ